MKNKMYTKIELHTVLEVGQVIVKEGLLFSVHLHKTISHLNEFISLLYCVI